MRRAERLFRLVALMRNNGLTRAEDLSKKLEVSVRTVYRDVAHLQGSGIPIEGEAGLGYILLPGFDLPAMTLTFEQIDALAMGLKFIEDSGDKNLVEAARNVRSKIQESLPEENKRHLESAPYFSARRGLRAPEFTKLLRKSIRDRLIVKLSYQDLKGNNSRRIVQPLSLTVFTKGWMMAAWCQYRTDFRYFRLDGIHDLSLTGEIFSNDPDKSLTRFREDSIHGKS